MSGWQRALPVLLLLASQLACHRPGKLAGVLFLAPGEQGDISNSRVELLSQKETSFVIVASTVSGQVDRFGQSHYELDGLIEGARFLRAWKDIDGDSCISDGDLVGVLNGRFRRGYNGESFWLYDDKLNQAEPVELMRFSELEITVTGTRTGGDSVTGFTYSFNHDVWLTALEITFPLLGSYLDAQGIGQKRACSTYYSTGWRLTRGVMPDGEHRLRFRGRALDTLFDTSLTVIVR
ncbi:MAG: hypothetical protein ABIK43_01265 [candidate division WOR-3 bacterium]